jgi:type II secretion system protein N
VTAAESTAPLGLGGPRRGLVLALAAVLLTSFFVVLGFPYDRIAPRLATALSAATGAQTSIGRMAIGPSLGGPELRLWNVSLAWPGGQQVRVDRLRVHPAWSLAWLRGHPALALAVRSPLGEVDGTLVLGREPGFRGTLHGVALGQLPLDALAPGTQLDGQADGTVDFTLAAAGPDGTARFEATKGSLSVPLLPIGIPFDKLAGDIALGGGALLQIDSLSLDGPLVSLSGSGRIGRASRIEQSPLALNARIEARDPSLRSLLQAQGVAVGATGATQIEVGGTLGRPQLRPGKAGTRAG